MGVIIGHIYNNSFTRWIYSFHIPLFFIISGCLLYYKDILNKNFIDIIVSRVRSILIPYIMFGLINLIFSLIANPSLSNLKSSIHMMLVLYGLGPIWFLPALFISEFIFILINKYINNRFIKFIIISILFIIPFIFKVENIILRVIFRSLTALGYITTGYYIFKYINEIKISWFGLICMFIISVLLSNFNGQVDLYSLIYQNPIIYYICGVIGSIFILCTLKKLKNFNHKYLSYFGLNSIIIMATHQIIIEICKKLYQILFYIDLQSFFAKTIMLIIIIIIEIPLIYIINNYLTFMLGKSSSKKTLNSMID